MMRTLQPFALLFAGASLVLSPVCALAQPSASDRETARALHLEGRAKLAAKEYAVALEKLKVAHDIMHVPTTGLDLATAQEALGLLVEARATALEVTHLPPRPSEPSVFVDARAAAGQLAAELLGRIPSLVITVKAPSGTAPAVTVDGATIASSALGLPRKINPGRHTVIATAAGYATETRVITVKESESLPVEIALQRAAPNAPLATSPATPTGNAPATGAAAPAERSGGIPVWAWVAGAAGIASLGAGIGFAVDFAVVKSKREEICPNGACPDDQARANGMALDSRWNRDVGLMAAFGGLGVLGVGAGILGIALAPPQNDQSALVPWIGPAGGGMSLTGTF